MGEADVQKALVKLVAKEKGLDSVHGVHQCRAADRDSN
jgi:hypothetical protein